MTSDIPSAPSAPAAPPRRAASFWVAWILLAMLLGSVIVNLLLMIVILFGVGGQAGLHEILVEGDAAAREKILVIPVHGILIQAPPSPLGRRDPVSQTIEALERAETDEDIRAIVLDIDSPGGGITDSDRIHHRIKRFREKRPGVPIVVSMGDLAASGGYYIAAGADRIFAHRSTITGSIGVIMHTLNVRELAEGKLGVRVRPIMSGPHKDAGSPFRDLTPAEEKHFQDMIDTLYEQFLQVILEGRGSRHLTMEKLRPLADGSVLLGAAAKEAGLVDELGYLDDALRDARQRANAPNARVVRFERPVGLADLFGAHAAPAGTEALERFAPWLAGGASRLMYLAPQ